MECRDIQTLLYNWEKTGSLEKNDYFKITSHTKMCNLCHEKYSLLLPLLERDCQYLDGVTFSSFTDTIDLSERIMDAVLKEKIPRGKLVTKRTFIYAAAAILILLLGFGLISEKYNRGSDNDFLLVEFRIKAPDAESVTLVGDFTDWKENMIIMSDSDGDGTWETEVQLKMNNIYNYNFLIDGDTWITDPETDFFIVDGFGGSNSLIQL